MIIKSDLRNLIFQMIDDPQQALWSNTNMDLLTEQVMDELWSRIHDYTPFYTSKNEQLTPIGPGYLDLGLTGVGTGQLTSRFHKLQSCVVGNAGLTAITYELADPRDVVLQGNSLIYAPNWRYVFYGQQLWLFPLDTTSNSVNIRYSYKPTPAYRTLTDGSTIGWPDGHESALYYEVSARAISKGGREDPNVFRAMADDAFLNMISSIKSQQIGPTVMWTGDAGESWGST